MQSDSYLAGIVVAAGNDALLNPVAPSSSRETTIAT